MRRMGALLLTAALGLPLALGSDALATRRILSKAVLAAPRDPAALAAYAEFLDQHDDPEARAIYRRLVAAGGSPDARRRLAVLDRLAADQPAVLAAGRSYGVISIPGPLRSFARMAALSPDLPPNELLGALARNIITNGYQASGGSQGLVQTEYLKLVFRYLGQARELERLAGDTKQLRVDACESTATADVLKALGFRMRGACGGDLVLETVNATRAFLSMDSGFPLAALEQALRTNRPFVYDYRPTAIAVLYGPEYWLGAKEKSSGEFIDLFLGDPSLCRLYLGLSKLDPATADEIRRAMPAQRVRAFAHVFDFFGGMFRLDNGHAVVPGGARSAAVWADMVGASPNNGAAFYERLVTRDDGWMASFFDSLARIDGPVLDYLTEPARLKRFYQALRGRVTSPGPARPVFRANTDLMLLCTRLRVDANGKPHLPGGLDVWKTLFAASNIKYDVRLSKAAPGWKDADDVVEALFGLSRKAVENEPLKIFLALSDMDRRRPAPLQTATIARLQRDYRAYGAQYALLNETGAVGDATIVAFLDAAAAVAGIRDTALRCDAAGSLQALAGLWQIFVRQKLIPEAEADATLAALAAPFPAVKSERALFDAAFDGVNLLLKAGGQTSAAGQHDRLMELLAGGPAAADADVHEQVLAEMARGFDSQRLIPLNTLRELAAHLEAVAGGEKLNAALVARIAARVSGAALPRAALSSAEKSTLSFGYWAERHIDAQRKLNLRAAVERAAGNPEKLRDIRGLLAPLLRDTLVGYLYLHYSPPGAQVLYTNPLFVRSHDFMGIQGSHQTWRSTEVQGSGWPANAGGRLIGSLATLPYALAEAEQNFLIPTREQALIWGDLAPQLLVSARLPRWWTLSPDTLHWAALHVRLGEALVAESALDEKLRAATLARLERAAAPLRARQVGALLAAGEARAALQMVTPAELFQLGAYAVSAGLDVAGGAAARIKAMSAADPREFNLAAISEALGTPKPTLANSCHPELLNLRTFPTLMGYSSRVMAESWESNNIYFAALADELYMAPAQLNVAIPEWTQKTLEQIFATHLEDWPALLHSMRSTGDAIRAEARKTLAAELKPGAN